MRSLLILPVLNLTVGWSAQHAALLPVMRPGITYVHVGKVGGNSIIHGLRTLQLELNAFQHQLQIHTRKGEKFQERSFKGGHRYISVGGPVSSVEARVDSTNEKMKEVVSWMRSFPILLWVRDPVARFVSSYDNVIYNKREDRQSAGKRQIRRALAAVTDREVNLRDLEGILTDLRNDRSAANRTHTEDFMSGVMHAQTGLAFYVDGVGGLERLQERLMFVGRTEHMADDWARFASILLGRRLLPNATGGSLPHTHSRTAKKGSLSAASIQFLRGYYRQDLECLDWLCKNGKLDPSYCQHVMNRMDYDY